MALMMCIISYSTQESYVPVIVEGPEVPDWKAYCQSLMEEATESVLRTKPADDWIGVDDIHEGLIELLCERGYHEVKLSEFFVQGSMLILSTDDIEGVSPSLAERLSAHNNNTENLLNIDDILKDFRATSQSDEQPPL